MPTLVIAAGGGGDAITSAALAARSPADPQVTMTYSWDRLLIDPKPGPRAASDFAGLHPLAPNLWEVTSATTPVLPAGSTLPRLADELPVRVLLLDPARAAQGIAEQITAAAEYFGADRLALVDIGGDVLTDGTDPGLRSPLADQLTLAACTATGIPTHVLIAGPGLDGELPTDLLKRRLHDLDAESLPALSSADIARVVHVFRWHPSEASGLLAAASSGHRGRVEVRDGADHVDLTDDTTAIYSVDAARLAAATPARLLIESSTLDDAAATIKATTGISEIDYETRKAERLKHRDGASTSATLDIANVDQLTAEARARGADYISTRRLAELVDARTPVLYAELTELLSHERPDQYATSLYRTR